MSRDGMVRCLTNLPTVSNVLGWRVAAQYVDGYGRTVLGLAPVPAPPEEPEETKPCPECGRELTLSEFARDPTRRDGYSRLCRTCKATKEREYRRAREARRASDERRLAELREDSPPIAQGLTPHGSEG
jgi:hypothetical protein